MSFLTSYWQVTLSTGRKLSERDQMEGKRPADWTLDLISTGDILKVQEVQLIYPGLFRQPAILRITEPGTAFQFKNASVMAFGASERRLEAQVIGKVTNKLTGDCECFIWDRELGLISYQSNIHRFGSWHPRIAPIGELAQDVIGLRI